MPLNIVPQGNVRPGLMPLIKIILISISLGILAMSLAGCSVCLS